MHTLLGLSSLLLTLLAGYLTLVILRRLGGWAQRRDLQLLVLVAPLSGLTVSLLALHHFTEQVCLLEASSWDYVLGQALPLGLGVIAVGSLGLGLVRLVLMHRVVAGSGLPACPALQASVDRLAARLGAPRARVFVRVSETPLALSSGILHPSLILSTWMLENLDERELESVLAHEFGHAARRDYPAIWPAAVLRDAFFYLPTSWTAYRQLQREKELACDDLAVGATGRPLALASALARVWQPMVASPRFASAELLVGAGIGIESRIERLLAPRGSVPGGPHSRLAVLGIGASALAGLLALEAVNLATMLAPMGCGPGWPLPKLF